MDWGKYNLEWLIKRINSGEKLKYLHFWGHRPAHGVETDQSCLSQWYPSSFVVQDVKYATSEHWMMAGKARLFKDDEILDRILSARSPGEAKSLGREIRNFDQNTWEQNRYKLVCEGNLQKFSQNPKLKSFLMNTSDRVLVEASPVDKIWGIGFSGDHPNAGNPEMWTGLNLLGFALMEVRAIIG